MVITSSESIPFLPFNCDNPLSNTPIYIAYHYFGAGHYDATESITNDPIEAELQHAQEQAVSQICYCGRKAKCRSEGFCVSTEKSRCPCVSNKKSAKLSASAATATIAVRIPKSCHAGVEKAGLKDGKQVKPLA
ncbi:unnamed protein product [Porites evermanni]|uniref:Uncharacterized protein n=1 Tax=Porites evermanni TaxID=104178 RepID=A0ABN8SXY5_9CNID|nr:unnamed protein product [Porites evermanni]